MSSNNNSANNGKPKARRTTTAGVDALLTGHGKHLSVGQGLSIQLIKGPATTTNADPVDPKAPHQRFPILAKFPVSVVKPNFVQPKKRLYQQNIPKAVDDSSEDDDDNDGQQPQKKKAWKGRRGKDEPKRQWILQDEVEFLETMLSRRNTEHASKEEGAANAGNKKLSQRYEGEIEQNTSHYVVLRVPTQNLQDGSSSGTTTTGRSLQVCPVPTNTMVSFSQPDARKTLSLSQAERVIEDQRKGIATMHHLLNDGDGTTTNGHTNASTAAGHTNGGDDHDNDPEQLALKMQQYMRRRRQRGTAAAPQTAKSRLLSKFQKLDAARNPTADDGDDDVMADVAFRSRSKKGSGGAARKELLETVAAGDVKVSEDGVLGGAHDAEFGGRQKFAQYKVDTPGNDAKGKGQQRSHESEGTLEERGADGAAMADDFYQRDVKAEYEEMDYDANEQFDDDDVDVGEAEVQLEDSGYGLDDDEDDADEDLEESEEEDISGAEGLASVSGFKAMLAKARGEGPVVPTVAEDAEANGGDVAADKGESNKNGPEKDRKKSAKKKEENDHISKILAATGKRPKPERHATAPNQDEGATGDVDKAPVRNPSVDDSSFAEVATHGPDGLRILTLEAVRREIWLNHGSMEVKRVIKIFDVKNKKKPERSAAFKEIIKELCSMKDDPVRGRLFELKPHYAQYE